MNEADLSTIEARAIVATAGPWRVSNALDIIGGRTNLEHITDGGIITLEDAEFIAAARQDVPDLLTEVRGLRAIIHDLLNNPVTRDVTEAVVIRHGGVVGTNTTPPAEVKATYRDDVNSDEHVQMTPPSPCGHEECARISDGACWYPRATS